MKIMDFMLRHRAAPEQIDTQMCLNQLLERMEAGLSGEGNIPMLPSFLSGSIRIPVGAVCAVMDAGGTNYRTANAKLTGDGWVLSGLQVRPMPGTEGELDFDAFYEAMAEPVRQLDSYRKVGFCFSYNVTLGRELDGNLDFWCKEVRAPECVGKPVGSSLKAVLGDGCDSVHVLNDSVAAMLGAEDVQVGVILGTGINVCYAEQCSRIPKIQEKLNGDIMIVSTEIGEFDRIPLSDFEEAVIAASDAPGSAQAEKQCSGGYLGAVIGAGWRAAAEEGLLPECYRSGACDLAQVSRALAGDGCELSEEALEISRIAIARAAKIAAILCAGPMLRTGETQLRVAVEGSQYWRLTGFRDQFHRELDKILMPLGVQYEIVRTENACLIGAARAAYAIPM